MPPKVLLVSPPWRLPNLSSLSLGTLAPILRERGFEVDELHGAILFPKIKSSFELLEIYGKYLFVPAFTGCEIEPFLDVVVADRVTEANLGEIVLPAAQATAAELGIDEHEMKVNLAEDIESANICLDRSLERMLAEPYDVVGFSVTFDDQVPAALALARRLKRVRPEVKIMFGGAACLEEQGDGLVASFSEIDAVCHTEGEDVIVPLVEALRGLRPLADVPGIAYRDKAGAVRHNPSPELLRDLDRLPMPDYQPFIAQYESSEWASRHAPRLMFETSRGCWWGQKSLCTFCGLNAEGLAFRAKSAERAYQEITTLWRSFPSAVQLQAADNIIDMKYFAAVFPRLTALAADPVRPLQIFYEVKTNMKPEQVEAMARGGVNLVQPGIESFSDGVLALMRKGCTALGQVQFIKWAVQSGVNPMYNVIIRNPGDETAWYREMIELLPYLMHLTPPTSVVTMHLERFSPYFQHPESWGITDVVPRPYYRMMYPEKGVDLSRIAYQFDFDHASHHDEELMASYRECYQLLSVWRASYKPDRLVYADSGTALVIADRREEHEERSVLAGVSAHLFLFLDHHRSRAHIADAFPALDAQFIDALLLSWLHKRWICKNGEKYLAVIPRKGPAIMRAQVVRKPPRAILQVASAAVS